MNIRKVLQRLARNKILKRHIVVNDERVPIYVSPDSQLKYVKNSRHWDQDLIWLAENYVRLGDDIWDIGANVGVFTFAAASASRTGSIYAFEPDTFLNELIKKSITLNGLKNIHVIPIALSDKNGFAEFNIAEQGRASNSLAIAQSRTHATDARSKYIVPTLTGCNISQKLNSIPSLIKIDVEGAEILVLKGLKNLLSKHHPTLFIELDTDTVSSAVEMLSKFGYDTSHVNLSKPKFGNYLFER